MIVTDERPTIKTIAFYNSHWHYFWTVKSAWQWMKSLWVSLSTHLYLTRLELLFYVIVCLSTCMYVCMHICMYVCLSVVRSVCRFHSFSCFLRSWEKKGWVSDQSRLFTCLLTSTSSLLGGWQNNYFIHMCLQAWIIDLYLLFEHEQVRQTDVKSKRNQSTGWSCRH
jgi:hypothetical protein